MKRLAVSFLLVLFWYHIKPAKISGEHAGESDAPLFI